MSPLPIDRKQLLAFRRRIMTFYRKHGRDLPWRATTDPYAITVSEIMLQQTQVDRVIPKYESWLAIWPGWPSLASASKRELLAAWSGLGYNRRGLNLGKLAEIVVTVYDSRLPTNLDDLLKLPGIGPYTARAILIFAHNRSIATIDTNVRKVLINELNLDPEISRADLEEIAEAAVPRGRSREWHNALMDFGAVALPRRIESIPPESKQGQFVGSNRQIRGEIIRRLTVADSVRQSEIARTLQRPLADVEHAAASLERDGTIRRHRGRLFLVD